MTPLQNRTWLATPILALLGCVCLSASAQQSSQVLQSYDVELLVFRTLNPNASPEEWSMEALEAGQRLAIPEDEPDPSAASAPPPPTTSNFPVLAPGRFKLTSDLRHAAPQPQLSAARAFRLDAAGLCAQRREAPDDQLAWCRRARGSSARSR